ncbi:hypothetical protein EFY79_14750 [Hanamia caeni]|jgi:hypothetical protein|uniref:Uncharacterized protein n=2 Tax=Hanamia caeni TaxID=2294116 RepID=A0A3M9NB01_9BACT|nr:hypothetical protein EFY79_14750 [Hanamia caeni]
MRQITFSIILLYKISMSGNYPVKKGAPGSSKVANNVNLDIADTSMSGATNVEFFPIANGTHATSTKPMMLNALQWTISLDK